MSFNLFDIANSGVRAQSQLLQTTSKNIANVNTEGYVRERTEFTTMIDNQVGRGETYRLLDQFAQKQLNRDTSNKAFFDQFVGDANRIDSLFSEQSNSLSTSINSFFNNIQESLNQPSSTVARSLVMTDAENFLDQMKRLSGIVSEQKKTINDQLDIFSDEANNLIQNISKLNSDIVAVHGSRNEADASSLYNERDKAIRDLSELVDIETLDGPNGEKQVYLGTGQALVMENGTFNLFSTNGDPDPNFKQLRLDVQDGKAVPLEIDTNKLKGKIGGLLAFRDDVLVPAQSQLGQMGLAFADSFNQQNRLGMDANGELGSDLFTIPTVNGLAYQANTGASTMTATLEAGQGKDMPASDFVITYTSATTVEIQAIDNKGQAVGTASTANVVAGVIDSSTITSGESFGLQLNVAGAANAGDEFQVKLNSQAAEKIELATNRPESLALSSPIRTANDINNISDASISPGSVSDVTSGGFSSPPPALANGDISLLKTANPNEYQITDGNGTTTFTITPPAENMLAQAGAPYDAYGFDFNIEGLPATGDTFTLEFNTGGFDDNRNGLKLAGLQSEELVRQNVVASASADNLQTFNQAYAGIVTDIGVVTNQAQTNGAAFEALAAQSEAWYESLSGVNLDEEAANLLRFQQSYAASAQVLATARTVFDTLLGAAR
ncbi:flagellar hook-associated protein FlgK [Pseudoalteromonas mariniglutinosa]|uniref:flagellar hook-associated protein FlgK n=1 Tax=Pseudoalteromonas mariniglutinosa TaxID=206042 RepID=UPI00384F8CBB